MVDVRNREYGLPWHRARAFVRQVLPNVSYPSSPTIKGTHSRFITPLVDASDNPCLDANWGSSDVEFIGMAKGKQEWLKHGEIRDRKTVSA